MRRLTLRDILALYARVGLTTFGGGDPTVIALRQELVEQRHALNEDEFGSSYTLARITPGTNMLASYLASGGTVFFLGDNNSVADLITADNNINAALGALGSSVSLALNNLDVGFQTAVGGQILANALTVGVNSFVYSAVSGVAGGTALFNTLEGTPFVAVTTTQTASVPESGSFAFIVAGLLGLGFAHRRRGRR